MPSFEIDPDETQRVIDEDVEKEYFAQLFGASLESGPTKSDAKHSRGQKMVAGDSGPLKTGDNSELWVHNPNDQPAELRAVPTDLKDEEGYVFDRQPRDTIAGVLGSNNSASAPASDDYVERHQIQIPIDADSYVEEKFFVPARSDTIKIAVDDAGGKYEVAVRFINSIGKEVVTFDSDDSSEFAGDPAGDDVAVSVDTFGFRVEVRFYDLSGAENRIDTSIYAR